LREPRIQKRGATVGVAGDSDKLRQSENESAKIDFESNARTTPLRAGACVREDDADR